ncbi:uncharacterized protein DNG_06102 [Cephalotrichum gorgonifer]|uniref:Uncharacterized protein n=1 Tax=Cephalotrichum gorgonifer TaxID=2041049 RepID=A0AAE8SWA8_9PEZI|nr:uncharacterized protein DNG_06102 [Cephalotrichum gorgonifer]
MSLTDLVSSATKPSRPTDSQRRQRWRWHSSAGRAADQTHLLPPPGSHNHEGTTPDAELQVHQHPPSPGITSRSNNIFRDRHHTSSTKRRHLLTTTTSHAKTESVELVPLARTRYPYPAIPPAPTSVGRPRHPHPFPYPYARTATGRETTPPRDSTQHSLSLNLASTSASANLGGALAMSSSAGAGQGDKSRRSAHVLRTGGAASGGGNMRGRSASGNRGGVISPPPKALQAGPGGGSSSGGGVGEDAPSTEGSGGKHEGGSSPAGGSAGSAAATSAMLKEMKEKDERIAALERELGVMEGEFARELDRLSQNESETATFWQGRHSALNQQFLRADTELRLLKAEVEVRREEREELREGWDLLRGEVRERDEEIGRLRAQVRGLKEWVSTSTRSAAQMADEVFGEGMAKLGNGLQNWVIVNFRRSKLDLSKASPDTLEEIGRFAPMYEELAAMAKVHLLQSVVSGILVDMVFNAYFVGLSEEQTRQFRQVEELLRSLSHSEEPINQWRSTTLSILHHGATESLAPETDALTEAVTARINATLAAVSDAPAADPVRDASLRALITSSVDLARLLAVQKAEFRVWMPGMVAHQRTAFDGATMEDIGGEEYEEDEGLAAREIWCVAFPGVIKRGDETGARLEFENVIAKARVLCRPE